MSKDRIVLATLGRPHGLRGALRARVYNPSTVMLEPGSVVRVSPPIERDEGPSNEDERPWVECSIEQRTRGADGWILKLAGVDDRDAAEALRGAELWVARDALPPLEEGEFYLADAPGYAVVDESGALVGRVVRVESYPTTDVLVIEREGGGTIEVPVVEGLVLAVEHEAQRFIVDREALSER
jgi:16S rRNA processing protein RimM